MTVSVEKWNHFECAFPCQPTGNPFLDVTFEAVFTHADRQITVQGFYDGEGVFKARCMPDVEGRWTYVTRSSEAALDGQRGEFLCAAPSSKNHGPVRVANRTHFAYADGTPYIPVGTTCYVWNHQGDVLEGQTLQTLEQAPFNKMRMCVFPKRYTYNQNEPPSYPFPGAASGGEDGLAVDPARPIDPPNHWDLTRFHPAYFQHLEQRILDLQSRGIEADLILFHPYDFGAWGFDRLPSEVNERYLRYLVARLGSFRNVWWSFANEYDLFRNRTIEDWDQYMQLVQQIDPYDHLRSIHNCGSFYDHSKPWVTHCSIQSHALQRVPAWLRMYGKPVIVDECGYEGDIPMVWGDLSAEEMVERFWLGFVQGGAVGHGETYLHPDDVLWWSKGGILHGQSAARIAFLRQVFEAAPDLTPVERSDNEFNNLMDRQALAEQASRPKTSLDRLIPEGLWNIEAAGYNLEQGYYLLYFGTHQPAARNFSLEDGSYRIDVIDTWNMTVESALENATGQVRVQMPGRKYMVVRVQRVNSVG